ncbi:sensor domain-containing diguanylate cyclase [Alicyclobacillus cycloheptanicus]|uniref:Diguanylate cyclase (GGDEF)-like protein n=1 Tax=Alicyclobacillus cycloheptanicus TaxID=1457 RepID=A0ABT9XF82_9BACL|nr:sensor domain-containing diguanylate cyclase [Alicyclobacillus cycloheptanicus]MDQ0188734.1 diguanylate cyclase (GGDEF)-like protein [Alicyclobacillus cycloheptanicus]WDM00605.1 sensor domain-containing diguanylate cyclase [Alicyclobacillus cycloheptanicus]
MNPQREIWIRICELLVGIAGVGIAFLYVPELFHQNILLTVLVMALAVALESIPVPLGRVISSLLYALPIGALAVYGTSEAVWLMIAAAVLSPFITRRRTRWTTILFNAGQYTISVVAMSFAYRMIVPQAYHHMLSWNMFLGAIVGAAVFLCVNHLLINAIQFVEGTFVVRESWTVVTADSLYVLLSLPFALLMIGLSPNGPLLALVAILPLVLLGQMMRMYRRTSFIQQIHNATTKLTSEFDVERIYQEAAQVAARLTYADAVIVHILDESREVLVPGTVYPLEAAQDFNLNGVTRSGGGVIWDVVSRGAGWAYIPDIRKDERVRFDGVDARRPHLSMAIFPMRAHGELQGAIVCYSCYAYGFGELTEELRILAAQVAVLIENAKLYQELQRQSWRDGATGLYNYRYFYEALADRVQQARMTNSEMSVVIMDVDYFKKFNDTYGHLAGDAVLKSIGQLLQSEAGPEAVTARYGGEEFGIILPYSPKQAFAMAERFRKAVSSLVVNFEGHELQGITVSVGIAGFPSDGDSDRDVLLKADSAMYWGSKQRGRNKTSLYSPEFDAQLFVDGLTGLYTYHFVTIRFREALAAGSENWGAVCIDLARFSDVNATFGFAIGNRVLQEASAVIRECIRQNELACRFSGDDFLILLQNVTREELEAIGNRVDRMLASHRFECLNNVVLSLRAHYATYSFQDVESVETVFEQIGKVFSTLNARDDESSA